MSMINNILMVGERVNLPHDSYVFCTGVLTGVLVMLAWSQVMTKQQPVNVRRMGINPLTVEVVYSRHTYDLRDSRGVLSHGVKFCRPMDLRKSYVINGWAVLPSGDCLSLDCSDCWIDVLGNKDLPLEEGVKDE